MRIEIKAAVLSLFACLALYGQSANGVTFVQPPISATVPPIQGGATTPPLNVNQKLAQIVNLQDFDSQPQLSCTTTTHDDGPAMNRAITYILQSVNGITGGPNGGGTLMFPYGKQCFVNSFAAQVVGVIVPYSLQGLTIDGNWSTVTLGKNVNGGVILGDPPFPYPAGDPSLTSQMVTGSLNLAQTQIKLVNPSDCSNYAVDDPIWIVGGYGLESEQNAELNKVLGCDATAGWLYPYWPLAKPYVGPGTPVTWAPNTSYAAGTTTMVGSNVWIVTHAGTSGPTTPVWRNHGPQGVDTQPPAFTGDGSGGIGTTGNTPCTAPNFTECPTTITVASTTGITVGMTAFGKGIDPQYPFSPGFPTANLVVTAVNAAMNQVTFNEPINPFGVCDYNAAAQCVLPSPVQFYPIPPGVIWEDQGPTGIFNYKNVTHQNLELRDITMVTLGDRTSPTVLNFFLNQKWNNVEFRMLGQSNEFFVGGAGRNWSWDRVRWGAGHITTPIFNGAGGQIGYNTVGLDINDSDLGSQDWTSSVLYCSEYSAQMNVHDSRIFSSAASMGSFNCYNMTWHHNQITIDSSMNTVGAANFLNGVCCGSLDQPNTVIDGNVFNISVPNTTGLGYSDYGMLVGGSNFQMYNNLINFQSGGTGVAVYLGGSGRFNQFTGNVINTDNQGLYMAVGPNVNVSNNIITHNSVMEGSAEAPVNACSIAVYNLTQGTLTTGMGVAGAGIADGTTIGTSTACPGPPTMPTLSGGIWTVPLTQATQFALQYGTAGFVAPVIFTNPFAGGRADPSAGIINIESALYPSAIAGPVVTGNSISNFFNGIWMEFAQQGPGTNFPYKLIINNTFSGVSTKYNGAFITPITYGLYNAMSFNAPYNANFGYQFAGRTHLWAFGPAGNAPLGINPNVGAPVDNTESLSLDSDTFNTLGIHSGGETNLLIRFSTPGFQSTIAQGSIVPASAGGVGIGTMTLGSPNSPQANRFGISSLGVQVLSGGTYMSNDGTHGLSESVSTGTGATLCTVTFKSGLFVGATGAGCTVVAVPNLSTGAVFNSSTVPPVPEAITDPNDPRLTRSAAAPPPAQQPVQQ